MITSKCERGVRFNGHELTKTPEAEEEDKDLSEEKVTMKLLESIATSQIDFLEFTHEVAEGGNMIPVLDMQVGVGKEESGERWFNHEDTEEKVTPGKGRQLEGDRIRYIFYSKPMANPRSGIPEATKIATMTAEIKRRWKNTWEGARKAEYERITKDFMDNLAAMGYPLKWREETLREALVGYVRVLAKV